MSCDGPLRGGVLLARVLAGRLQDKGAGAIYRSRTESRYPDDRIHTSCISDVLGMRPSARFAILRAAVMVECR